VLDQAEAAVAVGARDHEADADGLQRDGLAVGRADVVGGERLVAALDSIFLWYEQIEPLLTAVLRDADTMPIIAELQAGRMAYLAAVEDRLAAGWGVRGTAARRLGATIGLALDFLAWRTLHKRGLRRSDAIAVMSSAVRAAATSR
jgi:hypothetical protein